MAKPSEFAEELKRDVGALVTVGQAARFCGICRDTMREYLLPLQPYRTVGAKKYYFYKDVAKQLKGV